MKRKILLVDDEVAVLLTLKAVLEIHGFDVDTAASGREGRSKLRAHQYHMVITDMRMESDAAGVEVIAAAHRASYHPAVALLTAFPIAEEDWQSLGADKLLVKPTHTRILLQQIGKLLAAHEEKLAIWSALGPKIVSTNGDAKSSTKQTKAAAKKTPAKKLGAKPTKENRPTKVLKMPSKPTVQVTTKGLKSPATKRAKKTAKK